MNYTCYSDKPSKVTYALSQHPVSIESEMDGASYSGSEDLVILSCATICNTMDTVLKDTKNPYNNPIYNIKSVMQWKGRLV